jgi:uncharacterized protein YdcH (DUF465 family)
MERNAQQEDLKAHLMATDEEFRHLVEEHASFSRKIEELEAIPHPSTEEEVEEHRLKKLKLRVKDQIEEMLGRYKTAHAV